MTEQNSELGALRNVYGMSPIFMQRAAVVAILSFAFFLAMLVAFSIWERFVFFWLATAFLIVELLTLFGWLTQRRNEIKIYENGFAFRRQNYLWSEIKSISSNGADAKAKYEIKLRDGKGVFMNGAINGIKNLIKKIESETKK